MEVLKLKLHQDMVNYRREMSYGYIQSYPLPTPSMIRGMVHSLLDAKEYYPLEISIQGTFNSVITDIQKVYKFDKAPEKNNPKDTRHNNPYRIYFGNSDKTVMKTAVHGIMYVDELLEVNLIIHVKFHDTGLNKELFKNVCSSTIVLGRNEDIARVDECKICELKRTNSVNDIELNNDIFISSDICKKDQILRGTNYRLPFNYNTNSSFEKRIFNFIDVCLIKTGNIYSGDDLFMDNDNDIVSLLSLS